MPFFPFPNTIHFPGTCKYLKPAGLCFGREMRKGNLLFPEEIFMEKKKKTILKPLRKSCPNSPREFLQYTESFIHHQGPENPSHHLKGARPQQPGLLENTKRWLRPLTPPGNQRPRGPPNDWVLQGQLLAVFSQIKAATANLPALRHPHAQLQLRSSSSLQDGCQGGENGSSLPPGGR